MNRPTPAILVVGPAWVGDMVMAQSLFRQLRLRDPAPRIHVLAPGWTLPLLARMPEVEEGIEMPLGHGHLGLSARYRLGRRLRRRGYSQAIVLPNSWKSALVPWWAKIPLRTGWRGEFRYGLLNDLRPLDKVALPQTAQRFVALALPPGKPPQPIPQPRLLIQPEQVDITLSALGLQRSQRPLLALCPGAEFGPSKQWPAAYYGELAARRHADGWDVWLFGSANDRQVCSEVNTAAGGVCQYLAGVTTLGQALDLLSLADQVISNDSGLMHVAAALQRPLLALFGSTDPGHTPPLSERAQTLGLTLECRPCFQRICPLGHTNCLRDLSVEQVIGALDAPR